MLLMPSVAAICSIKHLLNGIDELVIGGEYLNLESLIHKQNFNLEIGECLDDEKI